MALINCSVVIVVVLSGVVVGVPDVDVSSVADVGIVVGTFVITVGVAVVIVGVS